MSASLEPQPDLDMTDLPDSPPPQSPSFDDSSHPDAAASMSPITNQWPGASAHGTEGAAAGPTTLAQGLPGASWSNKKAKEEYERASESLADRNWTMAQYGDPLAKK